MPRKGYKQTEEHWKNCTESNRKKAQDPEWIRKNKARAQNCAQNSAWRYNNKKAMQILAQDLEWQRNHKEMIQKRSKNQEWRRKNRESNRRITQDPEWQIKQKEGKVGGFWYGNVRYPDPPPYCELWCPDLWRRIDEAQNYQSILSGKTKFDNGGRALDRHHVYWQPKACCEWDEDTQGYYAWINIGTSREPNWYKHYISGDPNKFVLLTAREHGAIAKDKLKWIKLFEDLIEINLNGVCYLPKAVV